MFRVEVDDELIRDAGANADGYSIRGYDAVHLTSALRVQQSVPDDLWFSTRDKQLARAAGTAGMALAHEVAT